MNHDPFDGEDPQRDESLTRAKLAAQNVDADLAWLMSGPRGRRIVRRLLARTGIYRSVFSPNAMEMARSEGARQVGLWWLAEVARAAPAHYIEMLQEAPQK